MKLSHRLRNACQSGDLGWRFFSDVRDAANMLDACEAFLAEVKVECEGRSAEVIAASLLGKMKAAQEGDNG